MSKRLQIALGDDAWAVVEALTNEANQSFDSGHITFSDAINELIICSKPDVKELQLKHTSLRRSLVALAQMKDLEPETVIKRMNELRSRMSRRSTRSVIEQEVAG